MSQWKKVRIGDICKIVKGTTGIASAEPGQYPLVVTAEERKTCSTYQFDCEAVCIPLVSSSGHGKKSLKNVHYQSGKFALGTILCAVIPNNPQELDARYLHQYLQFYKDIILVPLMKGAANVSLSMKDIVTVEFPLPPIERQRELSNLFVSLQEKQKELSTEYEKQTEYAKLLRQNILQQAIEGKLTADWRKQNPVQKGNPDYDAEALFEQIQKGEVYPSLQPDKPSSATPSAGSNAARNARLKSLTPITDVEKPFEIPESWKWVHLNNIALSGLGKTLNKSTDKGDECPYLCSINVYWEGIDLEVVKKARFTEQEKEKYRLQKGDLLICEGGESGRTAIWNHNIDMYYQNALHRIRFYGNVIPELYRYILEIYKLSGIINNYLKGMGIQHLVQSSLNAIWFPLPPLKEQEEIVNKVETLLEKVTTLENQIQDRKSLSDKLIFGIIKENLEG